MQPKKPFLVWFTGLSGAGKSTLADALAAMLKKDNAYVTRLDGDTLRDGLCVNLGFDDNDRAENLRRAGEVCKILLDSGVVVIASFISPKGEIRNKIKQRIGGIRFVEIFLDTSLTVCEERDVKGLYKKARAGLIPNFTGISSEYEAPENPDLVLDTSSLSTANCCREILALLTERDFI